eukprot:352025_1
MNQTQCKKFIPFQRYQYPLQLAFCFTFNKSQGQSLKQLGIYLPVPVFAHSQIYAAVSRVKNPTKSKMLIKNIDEQGIFDGYPGVYTKNIVYKQALNEYANRNKNKDNIISEPHIINIDNNNILMDDIKSDIENNSSDDDQYLIDDDEFF